MLKYIFVKGILHFGSPNPQNFPPAAGISLAFKGEYIYTLIFAIASRKKYTPPKFLKIETVNFLKNYQKCLGYFGSDGSCSILKPPEKKHPSQKIETMNFLKTIRNVLDFLAPIVAAV